MASWAGTPKDSLDERRRQLLEWLAQRGSTAAGFQGLHGRGTAVGAQGGLGGRAPLPSITYNPFYAQIQGRQENFGGPGMLPQGVSPAAASAVQAGTQTAHGLVAGPGAAGGMGSYGSGSGLEGAGISRNFLGGADPSGPGAAPPQFTPSAGGVTGGQAPSMAPAQFASSPGSLGLSSPGGPGLDPMTGLPWNTRLGRVGGSNLMRS